MGFRQTIDWELIPDLSITCGSLFPSCFQFISFFLCEKVGGAISGGLPQLPLSLRIPHSSNSCRLILAIFCRFLLISADSLNTWYVRHVRIAVSIYSQYIGINDGNLKIDNINERAHIWIFSKCQMFLTSINDKYNTMHKNDFIFPGKAITKISLSVDIVPTILIATFRAK